MATRSQLGATTQMQPSPSSLPPTASAPRPLRVSQQDSLELDDALSNMLTEGVSTSLDNFNPHLKIQLQPELYLFMSMMLYKFGIWDRLVSPGAGLQNLKLSAMKWGGEACRSRLRKLLLLHMFLSPQLFPRWLFERFRRFALSRSWPDLPRRSWRRRLWSIMGRLEDLGKVGELAGLVWFLWDGQYPSLLNRALGLKMIPSSSMLTRMVSYEFMNRQLVWSSMAAFLPHALPYLTILGSSLSTLRQSLSSSIRLLTDAPDYETLSLSSSSPSADRPVSLKGPYALLSKESCAICYSQLSPLEHLPSIPPLSTTPLSPPLTAEQKESTRVHLAARASCRSECEYCYFCLGEALVRTEESERMGLGSVGGWPCLRCGELVRGMTMV